MKLHIYEQLLNFSKTSPVRLHMPAHKGKDILEGINASLDITELDGTEVVSSVQKAEQDIRRILGIGFAKIKSDGASMCIFSALHAVRNFGSKIIINRTAHKSVYNALKVLHIEPIIVEDISQAFRLDLSDQNLIGGLFTYPDYYGRIFDLESFSNKLKEQGKLLIIDNSHGGHFFYYKREIYAGNFADVWVDSAHKVLPTLNQGAMLLSNEEKLFDSLESSAEIFCTTSPSYPILASVEYGVKYASENSQGFRDIIQKITRVKTYLEEKGLVLIKTDDEFKIGLDCFASEIDNRLCQEMLIKDGIFFELNDGNVILFMLSIKTDDGDLQRLKTALLTIKDNCKIPQKDDRFFAKEKEEFSQIKPIRKTGYLSAVNGEIELIELEKSEGKICGENAGIFPPCYPIVTAGEVVDERVINALKNNPNTFGVYNGKIKTVKE